MKLATKYEILRGVSPTSHIPCVTQPSAKPLRIAYLIDEAEFIRSGGKLHHHASVFLEDSMHDWMWREGKFYYFGHAMGIGEVGDIVVVFEEEEAP